MHASFNNWLRGGAARWRTNLWRCFSFDAGIGLRARWIRSTKEMLGQHGTTLINRGEDRSCFRGELTYLWW